MLIFFKIESLTLNTFIGYLQKYRGWNCIYQEKMNKEYVNFLQNRILDIEYIYWVFAKV